MLKCKQCDKKFDSINSLRRHSSRVHKISSQELYNDIILEGNIPTCKCGCGEIPTYGGFNKGYSEWIRGHIARVENNWGHNETAIQNSAQTRREQFKNGERTVWNAGLTKETDERVRKNGIGRSKAFDEVTKREYSKRMRKMRLDGTIPTNYGKDSAAWKGGTSSINNLVRANKRLYEKWIYPILKKQSFTCQTCGSTNNLEVHHNKQTMSQILQKFVDKTKEYTFEEKRKIMNEVIDYHVIENVSGEVLCRECHKNLHPSYNT